MLAGKRRAPRVPPQRAMDDYYIWPRLLFGLVVAATAAMIVLAVATYLVTAVLLPAAPLEPQTDKAQRQ